MKLNAFTILMVLSLLSACGGGGGGGGTSSSGISYTTLVIGAPPVQDSVAQGASDYYKVDATAGQQLTFTLKMLSGNADFAIFSAQPLDSNTLIDIRISKGPVDEVIVHMPTVSGTIFIEVYGTRTSRYTFEVTTPDLPPVVSASPPASVNEGSNFAFQIFAHDPDDPAATFTYQVLYGPSGMQVDATGLVTWPAHGAIFDTSAQVNYAIRTISGGISIDYTNSVSVLDAAQPQAILRGDLSSPVRHGGFIAMDFDNDGIEEILVTDHSKHVYLLEQSSGQYEQTWMLPIDYSSDGMVGAIAGSDLNGDNYPEIIIGYSKAYVPRSQMSARVVVLDGRTRTPVSSRLLTGVDKIGALAVVDTDSDSNPEIVALVQPFYSNSSAKNIYVLDAASLVTEWQSPSLPGSGILGNILATGNLDADSYPEIACDTGHVYAYNGTSYIEKWNYGSSFGRVMTIADIDGDGTGEIVSETSVYSLPGQTITWSIPPGVYAYRAIAAANLDADPGAEIVIGQDQSGDIIVFDYNSGTNRIEEISRINSQSRSIYSIATGQFDADTAPEIIAGTGTTHNRLVVASLAPGLTLDWSSAARPALTGAFFGGTMATLSPGDRRSVFILPYTDTGYRSSRIVTLDTSGMTSIGNTAFGNNYSGKVAVHPVDYDGDSVDEIFLSSDDGTLGFLAAYSFATDITEWSSAPNIGTSSVIDGLDLNGDGAIDLVTQNHQNQLQVHDVLNDRLLASVNLPAGMSHDMMVTDIDGDSDPEIVFIHAETLYIYGPDGLGGIREENSSVLSLSIHSHSYRLDVGDIDGDGTQEIAIVLTDSNISELQILDRTLSPLAKFILSDLATDVIVEPGTHARRNVIIALNNNVSGSARSYLAWVDPMTGAAVSDSPDLIGVVQMNSLHTDDINGDSQPDFMIGTNLGMYLTQ